MNNELKEILRDEIKVYREAGHKFLNKEMSMLDFKHKSGGMGSYAHRGGQEFMIRLKTPSGIISKEDLAKIYEWAVKYKREWIHPTTREAIQFHGMTIDDVCDLMEEGLEYGIYSRGSGGNYPRNVAISPLSGVQKGEIFDVIPYAKKVNEHIMSKVNTYHLPRKIKIAFANTIEDAPHCTVTDLGFVATIVDGEKRFKVYLGGGLGRNSRLSVEYGELVNPTEILYHVEALTRLFIAEGNYENKNKARIRYIVERMGEDEFIKCYKKHLEEVKNSESLDINVEEIELNKEGKREEFNDSRIIEQKQDGLYSVYFHAIGGIIYTDLLGKIVNLTKDMKNVSYRLDMTEGMYIINLDGNEARKILELIGDEGEKLKVLQSVSCIGVPICQMGIGNSQGLLSNIANKLKMEKIDKDILPQIHISGCMNSCGVHEIGEIGFYGKSKRVNDEVKKCFELHIDGRFELGNTKLAKSLGDLVEDTIPDFIFDLYKELEKSDIDFKAWYNTNGEKFKEILDKYLV